jgi:hypothetical protein
MNPRMGCAEPMGLLVVGDHRESRRVRSIRVVQRRLRRLLLGVVLQVIARRGLRLRYVRLRGSWQRHRGLAGQQAWGRCSSKELFLLVGLDQTLHCPA